VGQPGQGFEDDARFKIRVRPAVCLLDMMTRSLPLPVLTSRPSASCLLPRAFRVLREKAVSARSAREHKAWGAASVASKPQDHGTKKKKEPAERAFVCGLAPLRETKTSTT